MDSISSVRQACKKHFPKRHIAIATGLSLALLVVVAVTPDESAHGERIHAGQLLVLEQDSVFDTLTAETVSDELTIDEVVDEPAEESAWTEIEVRPGDNLSGIFNRVGLSPRHLHRLLDNSDDSAILHRLHPGYQLAFHIPESGELHELQVLTSPLDGYSFTLRDARYQVEPIQREAETRQTLRGGEIADSLFMAGQRADIPTRLIMDMAEIFGGVIDFIMDPRQGDEFNLIYDEQYLDGELVGTGPIIGARFINRGREHIALRYVNEAGEVGYFTPEGESMRTAFLRNPLDVFRISSRFNPNRRHPILNTIRAHRGIDYAAPTGTPVRATADGTVTWAARNGSFGNLIVLEHQGRYETKYAHLNGYAQGIRRGTRVRQGQVIGYVGATGAATGPHLHYEFLIDGVHHDPSTVLDKLPQMITLNADEMPRFREHTRHALEQFRNADLTDRRLLSYADTDGSTASD